MSLNIAVLTRDMIQQYLEILQGEFLWSKKSVLLGKLLFEKDQNERDNLNRSIEILEKNYKINFLLKGDLPFGETDSETLLRLWKHVDPEEWPDGIIVEESLKLEMIFSDMSLFKYKILAEMLGSIIDEKDENKIDKVLNEIEVFSENFSKIYAQEMGWTD